MTVARTSSWIKGPSWWHNYHAASPDEDERQFRVWQFSFARYQLLTVNSLEHIGELPQPLLR
jgi:hypothetical protein